MAVKVANPVVVMKRYEMKYIISKEQEEFFKERIKEHMAEDEYGLTSIASLYYDTKNKQLINASIDAKCFKEKIRLRSYGMASETSPVFLELKRKAYGIVYKRRIETTIPEVNSFFAGETDRLGDGQIANEIEYFRDCYKDLVPSCLIIYDRTAYYEKNGNIRMTIDNNPRYRMSDLNLTTSMEGKSLLKDGYSILEIKVQDALPLWLCKILADGKIYKGSFSKYGEAYKIETRNGFGG
ncbi:MAG: polyphosphate polymerase domain-containing protein [Clostridia bacterium]|nr:polyphosphate polymerase domain-containing protein [Clostridia bacterium]